MAHQLSGHLSNAAIFALSAAIAVAAERLTTSPPPGVAARASGPGGDISAFVVPPAADPQVPAFRAPVRDDPFAGGAAADESAVASTTASHTVRTSRVLTAILVADDRRVAVIDDEVVRVGDMLPDGARVLAIQPNRVFVIDTKGRSQTLTLTNRGQ